MNLADLIKGRLIDTSKFNRDERSITQDDNAICVTIFILCNNIDTRSIIKDTGD